MPKETVIEVDIAKVLNQNVKPKTIQWKGPHPLQVQLDIEKDVYKVFDEDPLAYAKIRDPIADRYETFLTAAEKLYRDCDKAVKDNVGKPKAIKAALDTFSSGMTSEIKGLHKDVPKIADDAWKAFKKTHKEYSKYKLRSFIKVLLNIVGVVLSALGLGAAMATGGLTALIGLHGMAKSLNGLYKEVSGLLDKAEKLRKDIAEQIKSLKKAYAKKSGTAKGLTEVGKVAVEKILGKEFDTISGCRKNILTFDSKLSGVDVSAHKLAKELQVLLKATDTAQKDSKEIIKANPKLQKPLAQLEKEIDGLITKIIRKQVEVKDGRTWAGTARGQLDLIEAGRPGWTKILERSLIVYDLAMSASEFEKSVDAIIGLTSDIASTALDIEAEYKSLAK
jgi:hypothetical protein